jgi:hypothetical protein
VPAFGPEVVDISIILAPWVVRPSLVPAFGPEVVDVSIAEASPMSITEASPMS